MEDLDKAVAELTDSYNALSEAFIKFSLKYNTVLRLIEQKETT